MKYFQAFALSLNMLTIIPFFKVHNFYKGINGLSAAFYPLIGFLLGSLLWATHTLLQNSLPSAHLGVIIFALWVLLTGALHIDGLSDTIDGLFVSSQKSLEVMKDSHVGGMGMTFTFVFLLLKLSSVMALDTYSLFPVILMFSRLNAVLAIYFFKYVSSGVGALLKEELTLKMLLVTILFSLGVASFFSFSSAFLLSSFVLLLVGKFFTARVGGMSGDMYGFLIEVTELLLLNFALVSLS